MRSIEITTSQNVTIDYELASLGDRIIAFILDQVILFGSMIVILFASSLLPGSTYYVLFIVILPLYFFYSLFSELFFNGRSGGKFAMGLKVVKINGTEPVFSDYMMRWIFRAIDIYTTGGTLACLLISSTQHAQRLGDLAANTTVVKIKPRPFQLSDLLLTYKNDVVIQFPDVIQFSESEMILIKNSLEECMTHTNASHQEALHELALIVAERLSVQKLTVAPLPFLQTVLRDYIRLTRD